MRPYDPVHSILVQLGRMLLRHLVLHPGVATKRHTISGTIGPFFLYNNMHGHRVGVKTAGVRRGKLNTLGNRILGVQIEG